MFTTQNRRKAEFKHCMKGLLFEQPMIATQRAHGSRLSQPLYTIVPSLYSISLQTAKLSTPTPDAHAAKGQKHAH